MQIHTDCQSCRRPATVQSLTYARGQAVVHHETLLQCDVCERYACAECLQVYQIVSAYDFKLRLEAGVNHLGQYGLYLHLNGE